MKKSALRQLVLIAGTSFISVGAIAQTESSNSAENVQPQIKEEKKETGDIARNLLELQRSGAVASSNRQYISGAEMQRIYQRYLETFEHKVPEYFIKTDFGNN